MTMTEKLIIGSLAAKTASWKRLSTGEAFLQIANRVRSLILKSALKIKDLTPLNVKLNVKNQRPDPVKF